MEGFKPEQNNQEVASADVAQLRQYLESNDIEDTDSNAVSKAAQEFFGEGYPQHDIDKIIEKMYADETDAEKIADA